VFTHCLLPWVAGQNAKGQLGQGDTVSRGIKKSTPVDLGTGFKAIKISSGYGRKFNCAVHALSLSSHTYLLCFPFPLQEGCGGGWVTCLGGGRISLSRRTPVCCASLHQQAESDGGDLRTWPGAIADLELDRCRFPRPAASNAGVRAISSS
jgi:hypothetical protein